RLSLNSAGKGYDAVFSGGIRDFGNYKNGDGLEIPTSFESYDYSAKIGISSFKNQRLQIGWRQSFGRDILHVGLPMDTDEDNSSVASIDYAIKNIGDKLYGITFKSFLSKVDHIMENSRRPNFMMVDAVSTVDALTAGGKLEFSITPNAKNQLYTGVDFRYLTRDGERARLIKRNMMTGETIDPPAKKIDLIWQDAQQSDIGIFIENKFFNNDKLTFTAGARADFIASEINNPAPDFLALYPGLKKETEINISANISADYRFNKIWNLQFALGRGTRTANMEERFINHFQLGVDAYEYVGNPNLKSEANHQAELSLNKNKGAFQLKTSVFYSYITDYITAVVDETLDRKFLPMNLPQNARRFQNIDAATQTGFEIQGQYSFAKYLSLKGSASYTRAQNKDWHEALPEIPPFTASLGLVFEKDWLTADIRGRYASKQDRISQSFGKTITPSFSVFDLRIGTRPVEGLSIGAAMLNIFDANYYEHLNRGYRNNSEQGLIFEPGRNITAFVKYEF
ncbi:MAG TPA: TonB-dependent receptor, partial [Bacteroidetes bacterium]|nr:TonB-dependent receptor [Bacteroidota bacterium]